MAVSKRKFKTEVQQLMDLVIHSLYTNKDIFLREIISNASDAIDRCRFEALSEKSLIEDDPEWKIHLQVNKDDATLTVSDNGIGMNREEIDKNIGTIANSGTRAFLENLKEGKIANAPEMIGQFGVGFYSAFMVADKVTLITRRAGGEEALQWESTGDGTYTVREAEKAGRGTDVTLHLREGMEEFLEEWKIRKIVKQYSDFVEYPITMMITRNEIPRDEKGEPIKDAKPESKTTEEVLNSQKAIWMRAKSEVTDEQYHEFYKHISHDYADPLLTIPYVAEGTLEFRALTFIPSRAPFDLFFQQERKGLQLYVKRVFITDDCKELLPEYLRFVSGVVESNDLPLNVSREILQKNKIIEKIARSLTGKILGSLKDLKDKNPDKYLKFWEQFGKVIKEGLHFDFQNREKLEELILFESAMTEAGKYLTLQEYVDRMPEEQADIYYITGENREAVENSPHIEAFKAKGYDVLFMTDAIDEWVVQSLTEYKEKKLKAVNRADVAPEQEDEEKSKEQQEQYKDLLTFVQEELKEKVKEVRLSSRLTESVACLVADETGMNPNMERLLKSMNQETVPTKRILELNPEHPLMSRMQKMQQEEKTEELSEYLTLIFDQALLTEGSKLPDPARFASLLTKLMIDAKD